MSKSRIKLTASKEEVDDILSRYPDKDPKTIEIIYRIEMCVGKNKFDFSETFYTSRKKKLRIYCKIHKIFFEISYFLVYSAFSGKHKGIFCPECYKEESIIRKSYVNSFFKDKLPKKDEIRKILLDRYPEKSFLTRLFIYKSILVWGENKFDYSYSYYNDINTPIKLVCLKHNLLFEQKPDNHLNHENGCSSCKSEVHSELTRIRMNTNLDARFKLGNSKRKTTEEFILESKIKFGEDRFGYDKCIYKSLYEEIILYCKIDKKYFVTTPYSHLRSIYSGGCEDCFTRYKKVSSKGENKIENFLLKYNIPYIHQKRFSSNLFENSPNSFSITIDFVISLKKEIWIEYNGIQHYIPQEKFGGEEKFYSYQVPRDLSILEYCSKNNIKLIVISYKDYNNIEDILSKEFNIIT